jgi:hypothetical protein
MQTTLPSSSPANTLPPATTGRDPWNRHARLIRSSPMSYLAYDIFADGGACANPAAESSTWNDAFRAAPNGSAR